MCVFVCRLGSLHVHIPVDCSDIYTVLNKYTSLATTAAMNVAGGEGVPGLRSGGHPSWARAAKG